MSTNTAPPLRALQVFEAVGRCESIAEAGRLLGVSPSAVSQQLKLLEDILGVHLTQKEGRRLRLTTVGRQYHDRCAVAFEELRIAHAGIDRVKSARNLAVSALPSLLSKWLTPRALNWRSRRPDLCMYFDGAQAEPSLEDNDIDFRISYGEQGGRAGASQDLYLDCVVPVCSPRLLHATAALAGPADILRHPLISVDWRPKFASPPSWRDWFSHNDVPCADLNENSHVFSLSSVAIQAAIDGYGFALAQNSMVCDDVAAGRLIMPFARGLPLPWPYVLSWRPAAFDKPHGRSFHRWLTAIGKQQQHDNAALSSPARPVQETPGVGM